jgi:malonyl-CoA O-methyltransferase
VLDIGCGTGWLTGELAARFPEAAVVGIDLAPGMVAVAAGQRRPNLSFLVADGEAAAGQGAFDLVVSNAALQWMDAGQVFRSVAAALRPRGLFIFSTFGPRTLYELRESGFRVNQFLSADELRALAGGLFGDIRLETMLQELSFASIRELLHHLRDLGANTPAPGRRADRPAWRRLRAGCRGASATFELVFGLLFVRDWPIMTRDGAQVQQSGDRQSRLLGQ